MGLLYQTVYPNTIIARSKDSFHFEVIEGSAAYLIEKSRGSYLGISIGLGEARLNPRTWFEHYRDAEFSTHVNDPLRRGLIEGDNRDNWIFSNQNGNFLNGLWGDDVYVEDSSFTGNLINDDDSTGELLIDFVSLYGHAKPKTDSAGNVFYGSWSCDQGHDLYQYGSALNIKKSTSIKSDIVGGELTIQYYPFNTFFAPYNLNLMDPQYMEDIVVNYDMKSGDQFTNSSLNKSIVHASRTSPSTLLISENAHSTTVLMRFNGPYSKIDLGVPFSEVKVYHADSGLYSIDDFLNGEFVEDDNLLISSQNSSQNSSLMASEIKTSQDSKRNLATEIRHKQNFCVLILPNNQTVMFVGVEAQNLVNNPDLYIESQPVVTKNPSATPSQQPIPDPSSLPSQQPIPDPSSPPSQQPIPNPSSPPSQQPIPDPSSLPSQQPIPNPSGLPSQSPESSWPSLFPTQQSIEPSAYPSEFPTIKDFSNSTSSTRNSNDIPATIIAPVAFLFVGALAYAAKKLLMKSASVAVTKTDNIELNQVELDLLDIEDEAEIEAPMKQKPRNAFTMRGNRKKVIPISSAKDEGSITP